MYMGNWLRELYSVPPSFLGEKKFPHQRTIQVCSKEIGILKMVSGKVFFNVLKNAQVNKPSFTCNIDRI